MRNFPIVKTAGGPASSLTGTGVQQCFSFALVENPLGFLEKFPLLKSNMFFKQSGKAASVVRGHLWPETDEPADGVVIAQESIDNP